MTSELALSGFNVYSVDTKGREKLIGTPGCEGCVDGQSHDYTFTTPSSSVKGAKSIVIEVLSGNGNSRISTPIL